VELQANLNNVRKQGLGLAAISYDSPAVLKSFAERKGIAFPMLSDGDSKTIRAYGILNETVPANSAQYGIPHPGTFILNPRGEVVSKYFEEDYRERYTASDILVRQFGEAAGAAKTVVETRQLRLSTSASLAAVKTGQRIALTIDVDLKPKMHVYAPGVVGYIPIDWSIAESPAIKIFPAAYPASKNLHLRVINETVPVYQGRFQLERDIIIGPDAAVKPLLNDKGDLTIAGAFRYQACDDRTCYIPQTVPLSWTLRYEALDRQRAPVELQRKGPGR
jgi:hypothetical protein